MKKIVLGSLALFAFPMVASANMMYKGAYGAGDYSMVWLFILGVISLAVWTIVGILAIVWLWGHISHKKR